MAHYKRGISMKLNLCGIPGSGKSAVAQMLKEKTGSDLSAKAMLDYFAPLMDYLKKENTGRKYTLPELN